MVALIPKALTSKRLDSFGSYLHKLLKHEIKVAVSSERLNEILSLHSISMNEVQELCDIFTQEIGDTNWSFDIDLPVIKTIYELNKRGLITSECCAGAPRLYRGIKFFLFQDRKVDHYAIVLNTQPPELLSIRHYTVPTLIWNFPYISINNSLSKDGQEISEILFSALSECKNGNKNISKF